MTRLTSEEKKSALENSLITFKFPKKYFIVKSDLRLGKKFAIASKSKSGGLNVHSDYMTYEEMNYFFMGYYAKMSKKY